MAPSALDVGEHTLEPIEHWLDGIKAGFAEKFYWLFSGMGIEDTEDLRLMKAHRVAAMREDLVLEGCKPVTLDRLMDAVKAARRNLASGAWRVSFVWNTGRCGSTLLHKATTNLGAVSLSEPHWLDQLMVAYPRAQEFAAAKRDSAFNRQ